MNELPRNHNRIIYEAIKDNFAEFLFQNKEKFGIDDYPSLQSAGEAYASSFDEKTTLMFNNGIFKALVESFTCVTAGAIDKELRNANLREKEESFISKHTDRAWADNL